MISYNFPINEIKFLEIISNTSNTSENQPNQIKSQRLSGTLFVNFLEQEISGHEKIKVKLKINDAIYHPDPNSKGNLHFNFTIFTNLRVYKFTF